MTLIRYHLDSEESIAQQVYQHPRWQETLGELDGLMEFRVLYNKIGSVLSRTTRIFVDAYEVVLWDDSSVTVIEKSSQNQKTGALIEQRILKPLAGLSDLMPEQHRGPGERLRDQIVDENDLIDFGMVQRACEDITERRPGNRRATGLAAVLYPARTMAACFRLIIRERRSGGREQ